MNASNLCITLPVSALPSAFEFYHNGLGLPLYGITELADDADHFALKLAGGLFIVLILRAGFAEFTAMAQENVSWDALMSPAGFLQRINASEIQAQFNASLGNARFRLPSETEWEYAARGGPHWRDGFTYSGGNDIAAVAWYDRRHGDHTQPVAQKAPNQLGLYDMSGNVWEWCQDVYTPDVRLIPTDGSAYAGAGEERVWRGGCYHNWAMHCTVSKRYALPSDAHDGCVGFRLALSAE
jgi:formylglycine-generating enzyme required for sulfatase activity